MPEIARRAGVSHAALAYQVGDKAGIFTAIATEGFQMATEAVAPIAAGPDEFIRGGVAYIRFVPAAVFDALSRHLPADAVVTVDVGNHAHSLGATIPSWPPVRAGFCAGWPEHGAQKWTFPSAQAQASTVDSWGRVTVHTPYTSL